MATTTCDPSQSPRRKSGAGQLLNDRRSPRNSTLLPPDVRSVRLQADQTAKICAAGVRPEKPIVTSKANPHYQKRFDHLAERAAAGDWDTVKAYEVNGINSYAKMVRQYRDRLLAAHAASQNAPSEEEAA